MNQNDSPVGVFDSGVGGLSVLRAAMDMMPEEHFIYVADQAHVPYGPRPLEEVRDFAVAITEFLLSQNVKMVVLACNTASAAALRYLRHNFPHVPFVGMEPAVKPATEQTKTGVVGILATEATFQGKLYASVLERFAKDVKILQHTCPGLVNLIDRGAISDPKTRSILESALLPMLAQGIDTIVLGCTHYPFLIPLIKSIVGPNVRVIDPAEAVARQIERVLEMQGIRRQTSFKGEILYYTTGNKLQFEEAISRLLGKTVNAKSLLWNRGKLEIGEKESSAQGEFSASNGFKCE